MYAFGKTWLRRFSFNMSMWWIQHYKGEFCIYFTLVYLVLCYVFIIILWVFTCDFYIEGDTWVKGSKRGRNETKKSDNEYFGIACRNMKNHAPAWLNHALAQKSYAPACHAFIEKIERNMSQHVLSMSRHKEGVVNAEFCEHVATWLFMPWHDGPDFSYIFGK